MPRALLAAFLIAASTATAATIPVLKPGKPVRKSLAGGQSHSYTIAARPGDYLHATVSGQGIDLVLRLHPPGGRVAAFDGTLFWIALAPGQYRLEVAASDPHAPRGRYRLQLVEQRQATPADDKRVQAEMLCILAAAAEAKDDYPNAIAQYQQALVIFRELHERAREAMALRQSAGSRMDSHAYSDATAELEASLAIFRELGDRANQAAVLVRLGVNYRYLNQFDKSISALEETLKIRRALRDRAGEAEALDRLGMTWNAQDRADKAVPCYEEALAIARTIKHGDPLEVARELNNLAAVLAFLGQNEKAIAHLREAMDIVQRFEDAPKRAIILNDLGGVYDNLKQYDKAAATLEQALAIQEHLPDAYSNRHITLTNLGSAYQRLGQSAKAIDSLERALPLARSLKDRRVEGAVLNLLGRTYRSTGQYDRAIAYHEQARAILHQVQSTEFEALAFNGLMYCWKQKEQPAIAIFYGKQAVNLLQTVRSHLTSLTRELQESFLKGNEEPYHMLAELLIAAGRLPEAEQVMDLLKEQEYRDFVRRASATPAEGQRVELTPAEAEWAKRDGEMSDRLVAIGAERGGLLAKGTLSAEERRRLDSLERDLEAANRKFQDFLEDLGRNTSAARVAPARLEQVREGQGMMEDLRDLPPGTVAIYTLVTDQKYIAILITPDFQKPYEYPISAADLNRKILEFRQVVETPEFDPRLQAAELYRILLGKMAPDLRQAKAQTLMWSLDGCLRYLPLAALYDGEKYLVEQYRLSVFTPASNARLKERPSVKWGALGLGVTKERKGAPALPEVANELKGIIAQASGGGLMPGEIVLDEQFTEEAMRAGLRKRYPVVHIASHFHFQPGDQSNSFLLLGDGSRFTLSDLKNQTNLFSGVQLLTLSACSTGVSETDADGREVEGFGVLAQREGARSVVASLWSVADVSTSLMMQRFYKVRESAGPTTKLDALRDAQLELLHGSLGADVPTARRALIHDPPKPRAAPTAAKFKPDPKAPYAHPYYWAAFYLMGNWL
jgi:CHAT domain-containing protein/Tfp pilus assembly protein PilF